MMAMLRTSRRTAFSVEVAGPSVGTGGAEAVIRGAGVLGPGSGRKSSAWQGLQPSHGSTDDAAVHPAVAALPLAQKGLVLGALLARMAPETFAARFPGPAGQQVRAALESLGAGARGARASTVAELISLVRAPVPAGIERVHPGWLR